MHIHLPRPLHGWREFFGEVGVIVIGVLIALGAEQGVEALHWRHNVELARQSLREEIAWDAGFLQERMRAWPCIERRLDLEQAAIVRAGSVGRIEGPASEAPILNGRLDDDAWAAERASQTLTHLPRGELAEMSAFYSTIGSFKAVWMPKKDDQWAVLSTLHTDARPILPTELAQLRQALAGARVNERQMTIAAQHALAVSNALGIKPRARPLPATAQLCGLPTAGPSA